MTEDLSFLTKDELSFINKELVTPYWKKLKRIESIKNLRDARLAAEEHRAKCSAQREALKKEYCKEA